MKRTFQLIIVTLAFVFICKLSFSQVTKVDAIGITVKEMNRSVKFFTEVLGFKKVSDNDLQGKELEDLEGIFGLHIRVVRMQLGDEFIELTDYLTTGGRSIPEDQHSNDLSFQHIAIVVSDMDKAYAQLRKFNVEYVSTAPQTLPKSIPGAEGIKAFYFHDPDNHNLELIFFPKGKGQAKWQASTNKIFLGIDHTAIGVSNTDSWNKGVEQEHLNNVEGASLHITGYRTATGPGVEFLQYLQPGPGKPYPADTRADDIWYWQTTLITDDAETLYNKLKAANFQFVSKELVKQSHSKSFIVKDPDGHAMMIAQKL
jgi:catechol 2,3-dioxygenase-like lactoylglutathione lyase family enzyme